MKRIIEILEDFFAFAKEKKIPSLDAVLIVFVAAFLTGWCFWVYSSNMVFPSATFNNIYLFGADSDLAILSEPQEPAEKKFVPQPFSMNELKTKGCVADGFLSNYGKDANHSAELINRSPCLYLHRALETWANPPNFKLAERIMQKVDKPRIVYGMFLAEALRKDAKYSDDDGHHFNFSKMCKDGTDGMWGEGTCLADFDSGEYRDYLQYITRKAIDLGVQNFLFGQIFLQESSSSPRAPKIVADMRDYAREKGVEIAIGAQTNAITDPKYLRLFDYIEGGVGINEQGKIENGPCWSEKSSCWALLWNSKFSSQANNVFLNLDWNGVTDDDMSKFARMDQDMREKTLKNLYAYFTGKNMGFMMPYLTVVNKNNDGCYGPKKNFYSPDNKYKCKDEDAIAGILNNTS